jgi:hypothetical protein
MADFSFTFWDAKVASISGMAGAPGGRKTPFNFVD